MNTVIIGATGGIGQALTHALPKPQILVARNSKKLFALCQETGAYGIPADVSHELELSALASEIMARGGIQTLIYAVGDVAVGSSLELPRATFERLWEANFLGFALVCKHLGAGLVANARVYTIGARAELVSAKGFGAYASAKAALSAYAPIAALELKRPVTVVLPPAVATPFWQRLNTVAPRNAILPEVVAAGILADLANPPSPELRIG